MSIFCLGALLGCAAAPGVANGLGRKTALLVASTTCVIGAVCEASASLVPPCMVDCTLSPGVLLMLVGRVITGCGCGASTVVVPIYLGELAPPHLRGAFGVLFQLACVCALLTAQVAGLPSVLGSDALWPCYILGGVLIPSAIQFLMRAHLLESPSWLVSQGPDEGQEAERVLCLLRNVDFHDFGEARQAVMREIDYMQVMAFTGDGHKGPTSPRGEKAGNEMYALLRDVKLRTSLKITITCAIGQQFSGINNAFNFSSTFLSANGMDAATVTLIAVLMNVGNVFVTILSAWLMDRAGRKALLLTSTLSMCGAILMLSVALSNPGQSWTAVCAIISVCTFVCAFGIGMGPVPWLLPAELFPAERVAYAPHTSASHAPFTRAHLTRSSSRAPRSTGSAIAAMCNWLANFVCGLIFLPLASALGGLCFLPFLIVLLPFATFVATIPETRGKSVQQILAELGERKGWD